MKKIVGLVVVFLAIVAGAGWMAYRYLPPAAMRVVTAEEAGLAWQECPVAGGYEWRQASECFGHPMPLWSDAERAYFGERAGNEDLQLTIGQTTYRAVLGSSILPIQSWYTLYRDGTPLHTLSGVFTAYSPNISLQNIGGKAAWEFANTIFYDGQDLRSLYGLSGAYRPYHLGDKLMFVGKQADKYFVVYDGTRVGPEFDEIMIAYCCEPVIWSVQYGQGKYLFWARRNGQSYVVEIKAIKVGNFTKND